MNKKEIREKMFDYSITMNSALWLGGIDIDEPPNNLLEWAEDGHLESEGVYCDSTLLDFLLKNEYRMPFIVEFQFAVPRNFRFDSDGVPTMWSTGGVYSIGVFVGDTIEDCVNQACEWSEKKFLDRANAERYFLESRDDKSNN